MNERVKKAVTIRRMAARMTIETIIQRRIRSIRPPSRPEIERSRNNVVAKVIQRCYQSRRNRLREGIDLEGGWVRLDSFIVHLGLALVFMVTIPFQGAYAYL